MLANFLPFNRILVHATLFIEKQKNRPVQVTLVLLQFFFYNSIGAVKSEDKFTVDTFKKICYLEEGKKNRMKFVEELINLN